MCDDCKKDVLDLYLCQIVRSRFVCSACYAKAVRGALLAYSRYSRTMIEDRFKQLTTDPDVMEQWQGVCGFAACIHELLREPTMIRDLFEATFHDLEPAHFDATFKMADGSRTAIPFVELMGHPTTAINGVNAGYFVDWCLCRALMYLLKVKDPARYAREVTFSDGFSIPHWNEIGHFAIQTDSLAYIARELLGMKVLWVVKQDYAATVKAKRESTPRLAQATADKGGTTADRGLHLAKEAQFLLDGTTVMFTALYADHLGNWTDGSVADAAITGGLTGVLDSTKDDFINLPFNHWVIINKAKLSADNKSLEVSLWTWHTRRTITYPVKVLAQYLREGIFVKL